MAFVQSQRQYLEKGPPRPQSLVAILPSSPIPLTAHRIGPVLDEACAAHQVKVPEISVMPTFGLSHEVRASG